MPSARVDSDETRRRWGPGRVRAPRRQRGAAAPTLPHSRLLPHEREVPHRLGHLPGPQAHNGQGQQAPASVRAGGVFAHLAPTGCRRAHPCRPKRHECPRLATLAAAALPGRRVAASATGVGAAAHGGEGTGWGWAPAAAGASTPRTSPARTLAPDRGRPPPPRPRTTHPTLGATATPTAQNPAPQASNGNPHRPSQATDPSPHRANPTPHAHAPQAPPPGGPRAPGTHPPPPMRT